MYAYLGLQGFSAILQAPLGAEDLTPPLRFDAAARLCATLGGGHHTYLVISCPTIMEIVRARCEFGVIVLDRGQDGTTPKAFPKGACIEFQMVGAAVVDLVNETITCPRPCVPATIKSGAALPPGTAGVPYEHRVVISGTPPFHLGEYQVPQWMLVELDAGEIRLSGTPDVAGAYNVSIPLNSCGELRSFIVGCVQVAPAGV